MPFMQSPLMVDARPRGCRDLLLSCRPADERWLSQRTEVVQSRVRGTGGDVFMQSPAGCRRDCADVFELPPGFRVERLFTVLRDRLGSWVAITFDDEGRLIASDQGNHGLSRITPPPAGSDQPTKVERLNVQITSCARHALRVQEPVPCR